MTMSVLVVESSTRARTQVCLLRGVKMLDIWMFLTPAWLPVASKLGLTLRKSRYLTLLSQVGEHHRAGQDVPPSVCDYAGHVQEGE